MGSRVRLLTGTIQLLDNPGATDPPARRLAARVSRIHLECDGPAWS